MRTTAALMGAGWRPEQLHVANSDASHCADMRRQQQRPADLREMLTGSIRFLVKVGVLLTLRSPYCAMFSRLRLIGFEDLLCNVTKGSMRNLALGFVAASGVRVGVDQEGNGHI